MTSPLAGHAKPAPDNLADFRAEQAEEAAKKRAKIEKRAKVEYISATQIQQYLDCPRKWFFRYIMGIKTPPTPAMTYGTRIHEELEAYVNGAKVSDDWAPETHHVIQSDKVRMPSREGSWVDGEYVMDDQFITEFNCMTAGVTIGGAKLRAYLDLSWARELFLIRDWKTRSGFGYAPSSADLQHDIQAIIYSYVGFHLDWAGDEFEFEHVNILRVDRGGPAIKCVSTIMTREHVQKKIDAKISPLVERMRLTAKRELVRIRQHKTSCFKYGPCEHKSRCYAVPYVPENFTANGKGGESTMTHSLDELMGGMPPSNGATAPAQPTPAPAADDPVALAQAALAKAQADAAAVLEAKAAEDKAKAEAEAILKAAEAQRLLEAAEAAATDPVAVAEAMLAKAKADAAIDANGLVTEGREMQEITSKDVGSLDDLMPGGSAPAPNVQGPDVEGDRKPVDSHTMTIVEFPWKTVDGVGDKAAGAIVAWAAEQTPPLVYVHEFESADLTKIPGVGVKASGAMRAKIAEKRPFKPAGEEQIGEKPAEGASQEDILMGAKKAVLSKRIPDLTGATHDTKLAFTAWQKEQREQYEADLKSMAGTEPAAAPPAKEGFRPDMATEYDRAKGQPTVFCVNCYPDKGMDYVRFEDLLGPHFLAVAADLEEPFWCMPNDYGNGSKALGFRVYGHAADFKGRVIVFFGDDKSGPLAAAVREMALHADVVLRGR